MRRDNSEDAFRLIALGMRTQALCVISIQITHTTFSICMIWTSFIKYATPSQNLICAWKIPHVSTKSNMKRSERRGADGVYDHDNPKLCVCVCVCARDLLKIAVLVCLGPFNHFPHTPANLKMSCEGKKDLSCFPTQTVVCLLSEEGYIMSAVWETWLLYWILLCVSLIFPQSSWQSSCSAVHRIIAANFDANNRKMCINTILCLISSC